MGIIVSIRPLFFHSAKPYHIAHTQNAWMQHWLHCDSRAFAFRITFADWLILAQWQEMVLQQRDIVLAHLVFLKGYSTFFGNRLILPLPQS